ncbi:MAG TPA: COQ9 family protein [Novosphingobium sp.]|nr:COQ9 family protein [Novosphingobium sp.]HZV10417.1 COQ9 family protein [Novosphingobium sp.]
MSAPQTLSPESLPPLEERSLEDLRIALAPALADAAAFDGWSMEAVRAAAARLGVNPDVAAYAFQGGAMAMIAAFTAHVDAAMAAACPVEAMAALSVRGRIAGLIRARLAEQQGREEALRRALAIMALPQNIAAALKLGWVSADAMWRQAGDTAADYNHYTKRATLAAVYAATLAVFVDDKSEGKADTLAFLDRRIAGILRFEKAKARFTPPERVPFSLVRLAGRLRYPAR